MTLGKSLSHSVYRGGGGSRIENWLFRDRPCAFQRPGEVQHRSTGKASAREREARRGRQTQGRKGR